MIIGGPFANPKDLTMFRQEAETIASLSHPNIVRVHDVGEACGCPFFVMDYVSGPNLAQQLTAGKVYTPQEAVRLIEALCRVHVAHEVGIIHRESGSL